MVSHVGDDPGAPALQPSSDNLRVVTEWAGPAAPVMELASYAPPTTRARKQAHIHARGETHHMSLKILHIQPISLHHPLLIHHLKSPYVVNRTETSL